MAIADLDEYLSLLRAPKEIIGRRKGGIAAQSRFYDSWAQNDLPGVAPTTAVVPTNATVGAWGQTDGGAGMLTPIIFEGTAQYSCAGTAVLCDRLSHQGGLSAATAAVQTTNLPTAALTRYTSGVGVMAAITIYSLIGATATTFSVTYTNQAGTGSRVSPGAVIGGTPHLSAGRFLQIPLVAGDTGVKSIESVTLLATTTTAGNIGVTLYKPLLAISLNDNSPRTVSLLNGGMGGGFPEIVDGACLFWMMMPQQLTTSSFETYINFVEV